MELGNVTTLVFDLLSKVIAFVFFFNFEVMIGKIASISGLFHIVHIYQSEKKFNAFKCLLFVPAVKDLSKVFYLLRHSF